MALVKNNVVRFLYCTAALALFVFGLNVALVEWFLFYKPFSYGIVLLSQTVMGFLLNRFHVFSKNDSDARCQFLRYSLAAMLFRFGDWMCFTIQVELLSIFYIYAQAFSSVALIMAKYLVYRKIFESDISKPSIAETGPAGLEKVGLSGGCVEVVEGNTER